VVGIVCGHMIPTTMMAVAYATDRASHARQIKGDDPDKKGYPGPPGWGLGMRLRTPPHPTKRNTVTKPQKNRGCQGPPRTVEQMMIIIMIRECHYQMV